MHRIDGPGSVLGKFSAGNPNTGQRATKFTADWFNDLQENIVEVIEQADIPLAKGNEQQLYLAIVGLINSAIEGIEGGGGGGGAGVPLTRLINSLGLLTGGGTLANDLNLTVPKASGPEVAAGTDDTKAITPAALFASLSAVFATTGYAKLPGGLIVQWGVGTATGRTTSILTMPLTFPSQCFFAGVQGGSAGGDLQDNVPVVVGRGVSNLSIYNAMAGSTAVNWLAIGH